ncbi:PspC domain-containing protein [soil metagenome]
MTEPLTADTPPPIPPPSPPPRPPLRRSPTNRMLGGVCGGLSEHTGIDVILFRVGFVVLTIAGGAGLLIYLALWLLLPDGHGEPGPLQRWSAAGSGNGTRNTVLLVAAFMAVAVLLFGIGWDAGLIAVLAVLALAYLWSVEQGREPRPATEQRATTPTAPREALVAEPSPPRPPRQRSNLGRFTVSAMLITLGALALLDRLGLLDMSARGYLTTALAITGVGLLVGAVWGRSRGLIFLGIPLLIALIVVSVVGDTIDDGVGQRSWQPATVSDIDGSYVHGIGYLRLDLSTVDFDGEDVVTAIDQGVGYVEVIVPEDVDVTVVAQVDGGALTLFEQSTDAASDLRRSITDLGADGAGGGELALTATLGLGLVEVIRVR